MRVRIIVEDEETGKNKQWATEKTLTMQEITGTHWDPVKEAILQAVKELEEAKSKS